MFCQRLENAVGGCTPNDWPGRLDAWIEAAINGYLDEIAPHDLVFHEFRPSNHSRRMQHDNPAAAHLMSLVVGGTKAGAWVSRTPPLTAAMLFSAFHGAVDDAVVAPEKSSRKRLIAEVRAFCRGALGSPRTIKHANTKRSAALLTHDRDVIVCFVWTAPFDQPFWCRSRRR